MWLYKLLVFSVALASSDAACKTSDAKWKGPPSVKAVSSSRPERVRVDWQASISHPECADSFEVWVWKEGQEKSQGKKSILTGRMTLSEDVDLEEHIMSKDELSGADIKAICTEAGLLALRERRMKVTNEDFKKSKENVLYRKQEGTPEGLYM